MDYQEVIHRFEKSRFEQCASPTVVGMKIIHRVLAMSLFSLVAVTGCTEQGTPPTATKPTAPLQKPALADPDAHCLTPTPARIHNRAALC